MKATMRAGVLLVLLGGCSAMSYIPIVGSFAPNPAMEQADRNNKSMMVQMTVRPGWKSLIDAKKFKSAIAYLDTHKEEMTEEQYKNFVDETTTESRLALNNRVFRFRSQLGDIKSQRDLAAMKSDDFISAFSLPASDEVIQTTPVYEWARGLFGDLEDFRTRKPSGESLFKGVAVAAALPADEDGESRWFETLETLAFNAASEHLRGEVERAQDAAQAEREESRTRAVSVRDKWTLAVVQALPAENRHRKRVGDHDLALGKLVEGFPRDLEDLDKVDISACIASENPEAALRAAEKTLKALESRTGISRESRQKLYTMIVTVVSLRNFQTGREEIDALGELRGYGDKLAKAGGPVDSKKYGARVQKVFDALR